MAHMKIDLYSVSLRRFTSFELFFPCDTPPEMMGNNPHYQRPTKTAILLHGYSGSSTDWMLNSAVQEFSGKYNLAIACPSGENSFYLNQKGTGRAYADLVGKEIPAFLEKTFGLVQSPENTIVAGFSMGGFGALHTALAYPGTFGHAIALSSALIHREVAAMVPGTGNPVADYDYYAATFGEPKELLGGPNDPEGLVKGLKAEGKTIPGIYMACGSEDFLIEPNRAFHQFLEDEGVPVTYHESPGVHNFVFWNQYIERGIRWALGLPESE